MKIVNAANVELADDELQGTVKISPKILKLVESLVEPSLPEDSLAPVVHHFIIGGLAYLTSAPVSGMNMREVAQLLKTHKTIFTMFAHALSKAEEPK